MTRTSGDHMDLTDAFSTCRPGNAVGVQFRDPLREKHPLTHQEIGLLRKKSWHRCLTLTIDVGYLGWSTNRVEIPTLGLTVGRF